MLKQLDSKIRGYFISDYTCSPIEGLRDRILSSYAALFFIFNSLKFDPGYPKILISAFGFYFLVYAVYCWRFFLMSRRDGSNLNEPLFFVEPASPFRKWLFLLSIVIISYLFVSPIVMPSLLSCEWLHRIAPVTPYLILCSFSGAVVSVEVARLFTSSWSERRHFVVVFIVAFAFLMLIIMMDDAYRPLKYFWC